MEPDFRPESKPHSGFPETPSNRVFKAALCTVHGSQTQQGAQWTAAWQRLGHRGWGILHVAAEFMSKEESKWHEESSP